MRAAWNARVPAARTALGAQLACCCKWMTAAASVAAMLPTPTDPRTAVTARVPQVRAGGAASGENGSES